MGASSSTFVCSKNGAKYMYFLLDKKNEVLTRFLNLVFDQVEVVKWI